MISSPVTQSRNIYSRNVYYPPEMEYDYFDIDDRENWNEHKSSSTSELKIHITRPIPVHMSKRMTQYENEIALESRYMEIKSLEMLSLITGTPTDVLLAEHSLHDRTVIEGCHRDGNDDSASIITEFMSRSLPNMKVSAMNHDRNNNSTTLRQKFTETTPKMEKYKMYAALRRESFGYNETKRNDSEDYLFEMEL